MFNIRLILLLTIDAIITIFSIYLAYLLRFDFKISKDIYATLPYVLTAVSIITLISLYANKIYKRVWQYASVGDIASIVKAVVVATGCFFLIHHIVIFYFFGELVVPRSIYILSCILITANISASRFLWRMIIEAYFSRRSYIQPHQRKALIIGAGGAGTMVIKELKSTDSEIFPVAFIDDDPKKLNMEILGVPVVGDRSAIPAVVEKMQIQDIIIALPSVSKVETANILEICKQTKCLVKIIPMVNDLINGKLSVSAIRNVSVEDLLGRDPVKIDLAEIAKYVSDKVVLVTGAGGSIGSELCRQISLYSPQMIVLLGHGENSIYEIELELKKKCANIIIEPVIADIQDRTRIKQVFELYRPQVVFHAAAHKHVPLMEKNPIEAIKNNILGTKNVAEIASETHVDYFVMISTDKAVNSTNIMGASKRVAEMIIQQLNSTSSTTFAAVRFGNVLGSRGSVIPVFKKQIEEGGPVTVTHPDMVRYFMTIPEAVQLVIQTGALAKGGEIFILDMGKPVVISQLAHDLIRLSGLEPNKDIEIVYTGIRPGEKLFEEILTSEEGTSATKHDRIYVSKPDGISNEKMASILQYFQEMAANKQDVPDNNRIKDLLKELVPTYQWSKSGNEAKNYQEAFKASLEVVASIENK